MYRLSLSAIPRSIPRSLSLSIPSQTRSFALTATRQANERNPPTSQGHATSKAHQTGHKDGDVQSASVRAGQDAKSKSKADVTSGSEEPFDAARQGNEGGSAKSSPAKKEAQAEGVEGHAGAFQDQVGGQEDASSGVTTGKKEEVPGAGMGDTLKETVKNTVGAGFDGLKKMRSDKKNLHTSARASLPQSDTDAPSRDIPGSRKPVEKSLEGEQNEHLKHKNASEKDSGKGNAASEPHLPSHQANKSHGGDKGERRGLHTSSRVGATSAPRGYARAHTPEGTEAGHNIPPEGQPKIDEPYAADAIPPAQPGDIPSSQIDYSSTAVDPPNEALRKAAKEGTLGERNPQPQSEFGRIGLDEAWKERK